MTDVSLSAPAAGRDASRAFIFGPRSDLAVSIGGAAAGFALYFLYTVIGIDVVAVWLVWVVTLDTPHFFASYMRTYLDKEERRESRRLLAGTLALFLVMPVVFALCWALYSAGVRQFKMPYELARDGIGIWAYWHVTRQHYGILRLYNRKAGEHGSGEAALDRIVLYGALGLAFVGFLARQTTTRGIVGLPPWTGFSQAAPTWDRIGFAVAFAAFAVLVVRYATFQTAKFLRREPLNAAKLVFMASVISLHGVMGFYAPLSGTILGFTAVVTIYHDIQYFAVVWLYAKNRYTGSAGERRSRFGAAGTLSRSFPLFLVTGIVTISLPVWGFGCLINRISVCSSGLALGTPTFMGYTGWALVFIWLTSSFQMHHYVLDQYIWRPSRSAQLRRNLQVER